MDARTGESRAGIAVFAPSFFAVWMAAIGVSMLRRGPELVAADV
jgi:hypothetical protein